MLEAQNRALAKVALTDAERVEATRRAELEAPAKAEKVKTIVEAEAAAQKQRIDADAATDSPPKSSVEPASRIPKG